MVFFLFDKIYNYLVPSQTKPVVLILEFSTIFIFITFTSKKLFLNQSTEGFFGIVYKEEWIEELLM